MTSTLEDRHAEVSKWVLGYLMTRPARLQDESVLAIREQHFPGLLGEVYGAIQQAVEKHGDENTIHVPQLMKFCAVHSDLLWECKASGDIAIKEDMSLDDLVDDLLQLSGARHRARQLASAVALLEDGKPLPDVDSALLDSVGTTAVDLAVKHDLTAAIEDTFTKPPLPGIKSGIYFVDNRTGGIAPKETWLLAGRYKGGKTRTANFMTVHQLLNQHSVTHFALEGAYTKVALNLVAVLATHYLLQKFGDECPDAHLSGKRLLNAGMAYRDVLNERQIWALREAQRFIAELEEAGKLRVYTREPDHGGLTNWADIRRFWKAEAQRGMQIGYIDYAQMLRSGNASLTEDMAQLGTNLIDLCIKTGTCGVLLAQRNEATNERSARNEGEDFASTAGIKGGGDLPSAADLTLHVSNDIQAFEEARIAKSPNAKITVSILMGRDGDAGSRSVMVNRSSGYIIDRPPNFTRGQSQNRFKHL